MTKAETDLMKRLFPDGEKGTGYFRLEIRHTLSSPFTIPNPILIDGSDLIASKAIRECEEAAAALKIYRKALAERKEQLDNAPSVPVARLERKLSRYDNRVYYYFSVYRRIVETGADVRESVEKFPGGQWRKAKAAFLAYLEAHPDAVAENLVSA